MNDNVWTKVSISRIETDKGREIGRTTGQKKKRTKGKKRKTEEKKRDNNETRLPRKRFECVQQNRHSSGVWRCDVER